VFVRKFLCNLERPVNTAILDNDDLRCERLSRQKTEYLLQRIRQAVLLVMGRDDDRQECGQDVLSE
jgi:hypothetical protein